MKIVLGIIFLCFAHVTLGQNDFFLPPGVELSAAQLKDLAEDALLTAVSLRFFIKSDVLSIQAFALINNYKFNNILSQYLRG